MKKWLVFVFLLGVNLSFAEEIIPSRISRVSIFPNQALVTREATFEVKPGLNRLLLEVTAFSLDKDSLKASVFGEGEILGVQYTEIPLKEVPQEKIKNLEKVIEQLKDQIKTLNDEKKVLEKKERFLDSLVDFSKTELPQEMKTNFPQITDLKKILSFLDENLTQINKSREALDLKIRELRKELEVKEVQLSSLKRPSQKVKKAIEILFDSPKRQKVKAEASYLVYNVSWQPLYKVDVPLDLRELSLTMFSKIHQKTGEDWLDVKVAISNVIPLSGLSLPSLSSWWLDIQRESGRWKALKEMEVSFYSQIGKDKEAGFAQAQRKELPLSFEYFLPQNLTIPSQEKETILPLFSKILQGEFYYYAVPKVSPLTFLVCKSKPDKELLAGYLNVYLGGRFIGKTYLEEKKPGEEFRVVLGADREIKIKREKIEDKIEETFFGKIKRKTIVRKLAYKISIENLKDKDIYMWVLDNIPVSRTDRIEVKDVRLSPRPEVEDYQDKKGLNLWKFKIAPKQKKEIKIEFTLTYPEGTFIWGL